MQPQPQALISQHNTPFQVCRKKAAELHSRARVPAPSPHRHTVHTDQRCNPWFLYRPLLSTAVRVVPRTACMRRRSVAAPHFIVTASGRWLPCCCAEPRLRFLLQYSPLLGLPGAQFSQRNWRQDTKSSDIWRGERTSLLWCCDTSRRWEGVTNT